MSSILEIENLSKQYRLGYVGTGTLGHDLNRWWHTVRGKEDPYLKIGEANDRAAKGNSEYVWALQDINLQIQEGEVLGIIGANGSGKSTLLKILSKVTGPTTGTIKSRGRIASLLEVGTGFHGELTGRENIFLNGAILGMTKQEISSKIDEIIDFSGCERYIDTPVKRYSSGMYVRLAFAVAAHLEPEILIVDEVLAVGDVEFQKKAIGKMKEVSSGQGRTVLFVSHNMGAIKQLCDKTLVLKNGRFDFLGDTSTAIDRYLKNENKTKGAHYLNSNPNIDSDIIEISIQNSLKNISSHFKFDEQISFRIKVKIAKEHLGAFLGVRVKDQLERNVFTTQQAVEGDPGYKVYDIEIPCSLLVPNDYFIVVGFHIQNKKVLAFADSLVSFRVEETGSENLMYANSDYGCISVNCKWNSI